MNKLEKVKKINKYNKSLIVYFNHALLGFYFRQSVQNDIHIGI